MTPRPLDWWTVAGQTGWVRPGLEYLCRDPDVLRRVTIFTYDADSPGFAEYCRSRLGVSPLEGVQTSAVRAAFQDAWDVFTILRECVEIFTPAYPQARRYLHGMRLPDGVFFAFERGVSHRVEFRTGVRLSPGVSADDARLALYPTLNY